MFSHVCTVVVYLGIIGIEHSLISVVCYANDISVMSVLCHCVKSLSLEFIVFYFDLSGKLHIHFCSFYLASCCFSFSVLDLSQAVVTVQRSIIGECV